jgi:nucleotide-binding universal stress UspA family protein
MYKKILVPLDGSALAEKVLPFVCSIARNNNAKIVLLRIAEYPYAMYTGWENYSSLDPEFNKNTSKQKKAICNDLAKYLERIASNLQADGLRVITEVCEGPVVDTILASVDRLCIDIIAMSTVGDGGGNPWMLGSVADRVLRESKVQIFLVRPNQGSKPINIRQEKNNRLTRMSKEKADVFSSMSI